MRDKIIEYCNKVRDMKKRFILLLVVFSMMIGMWIMGILLMNTTNNKVLEKGYRMGQIDAMNGKYKYEMSISQDTTYTQINNNQDEN